MTKTTKPRIIIVDKNDKVIGYKERVSLNKKDIYRVAALWITNSRNEILLAKRHRTKLHHPGKWGPAVSGTVDEGETYERNIIKEAEEELGLKNIRPRLGPKTETNSEYHHFTQWYILIIDKDVKEFTMQKDEVEEIKWFSQEVLMNELQGYPNKFLPKMKEYVQLFKTN